MAVLFADVSGYTRLSERLDPEEVASAMQICFAILGEQVTRAGGTIVRHLGDCVQARFALPGGKEATAAAQCAFGMHGEMEAVSASVGSYLELHGRALEEPLRLHIGVASGREEAASRVAEQMAKRASAGETVIATSRPVPIPAGVELLELRTEEFDSLGAVKVWKARGSPVGKRKPIAPARRAPGVEGERRPVVILFAILPAESDARDRAERFFEEEAGRWGGTPRRAGESQVMAMFGAVVSHGDDLQRAVRCAISVRGGPPGAGMPFRIGLNTGQVVAGRVGSGETTVMGDAVNVAQRIAEIAAPGEAWATETVLKPLGTRVEVQGLMARTVRGRNEPLVVGRLGALRLPPAAGLADETRMVGREGELRRIEALLAEAARGKCRLVIVAGETGMGKSLLLDEASRLAVARGFRTEGGPAGLRALPGRLTEAQGILLISDDPGPTGTTMRASLVTLRESVPTAPLLILVSQRREERDAPELYAAADEIIILHPLSESGTAELLESRLGGRVDPMFAHAIHAKSGGQPGLTALLLRETIRNGLLREASGGFATSGDLSSLPATVHEILQARLDHLPAQDRELLKVASVFGERFEAQGLLGAIRVRPPRVDLASSEADLRERLDALVREGLLAPAGEEHYRFVPQTLHEVASSLLLRDQREEWLRRQQEASTAPGG